MALKKKNYIFQLNIALENWSTKFFSPFKWISTKFIELKWTFSQKKRIIQKIDWKQTEIGLDLLPN